MARRQSLAAELMRAPTAERALVRALPGGRLHLQDGPIDVILKAWGAKDAVEAAHDAAARRFASILDELTSELPELRRAMADHPRATTPVARRMTNACAPFADEFITPMAAVAGSVADELLCAMCAAAPLDRAFVNDGGDIAIHVALDHRLTVGVVTEHGRGLLGVLDGSVSLDSNTGVGGVATSGAQGRSFSLGVADAVTVLARTAATADAAATIIANAVNIDSVAVRRAPARSLDPDSDLGDRLVTIDVGPLNVDEVTEALARGAAKANDLRGRGLIVDAALALRGQLQTIGDASRLRLSAMTKM